MQTWSRRLRAWTGLVLMAYVSTHLANHALGLVSVQVMQWAADHVFVVWHAPPGEYLLVAALLVHVLFAMYRIATWLAWRLPRWQWAQLALGLAIPLLLVEHLIANVWLEWWFGTRPDYYANLLAIWPEQALAYTLLILVVWAHGCLGLHHWWRLRPGYVRLQPYLLAVAVALPVASIGGFVAGGRDVAEQPQDVIEARAALGSWRDAEALEARLADGEVIALAAAGGALAVALGWRLMLSVGRRRNLVRVTYASGRVVRAPRGLTLLETSRNAGIPHASVCGGRARCSTCRVRVIDGLAALPPPTGPEAALLKRFGHPADVRLACQIRPEAPIQVALLVGAEQALADARSEGDPDLGREREIAVLFCDLRGFTQLSEKRLPYDVVYILNQYFRAMGQAIDAAGGHVDKVLGDGVMALFGVDADAPAAARGAIRAAVAMSVALERLNADLAGELDRPLRLAVGVHLGPAVVGVMGHGAARQLTAIGDTVNVASRLEALAKQADAQLAVSDALLRQAGIERVPDTDTSLRGRDDRLAVHIYPDAQLVLQHVAETA